MNTCTVQTADPNWFWLLSLLLSSVLGFPLYLSTANGRATAHQLYCFAIEVGFGANAALPLWPRVFQFSKHTPIIADLYRIKKELEKSIISHFASGLVLRCEHFKKLDILRIFAPQKSNWNTLYVELESQDQVDWVMAHAKWIPEVERGQVQTKVVKYVPKQLYSRWNALQGKAFNIRKDSNWTVQTKIGHGESDFFLKTRQKGERIWSPDLSLPEDLPKVELEFLRREDRSPKAAPGRDRYKESQRNDKRKDRPSSDSSGSSSPPQKQAYTLNSESSKESEGLLARPDISRVEETAHPPGSPGHGIRNPGMFGHLDSACVSSRRK